MYKVLYIPYFIGLSHAQFLVGRRGFQRVIPVEPQAEYYLEDHSIFKVLSSALLLSRLHFTMWTVLRGFALFASNQKLHKKRGQASWGMDLVPELGEEASCTLWVQDQSGL